MIVHLGVILVAVALVASNAYTSTASVTMEVGTPIEVHGHEFRYVETVTETDARTEAAVAQIRVDGDDLARPALTTYRQIGDIVPTPAVVSRVDHDLYLALQINRPPRPGDQEVVVEVSKKPLIVWMWVGGLIMAIGTVLSAVPSKRRRDPLDPVSAPIDERIGADHE